MSAFSADDLKTAEAPVMPAMREMKSGWLCAISGTATAPRAMLYTSAYVNRRAW